MRLALALATNTLPGISSGGGGSGVDALSVYVSDHEAPDNDLVVVPVDVDYTGAGFPPVAGLHFSSVPITTPEAVWRQCFGFYTATEQGSMSTFAADGGSGMSRNINATRAARCITLSDGTMTQVAEASILPSGSRLQWEALSAVPHPWPTLELGGAALTAAKIVHFAIRTSNGVQSVNVGWRPSAIILTTSGDTSMSDAASGNAIASIGFADGTNQACVGYAAGVRICRTNLAIIGVFGGAISWSASVTFTETGFDLTVSANGFGHQVEVLCLQGGEFEVFSATQPTETGNQIIPLSIHPKAILQASVGAAVSSSVSTKAKLSLGMTDGTRQFACAWASDDGVATDSTYKDDKILVHLSEGTPTINAEAEFVSFGDGTFTRNWTIVDATERQDIGLAIG